jgi:hypothetical protein
LKVETESRVEAPPNRTPFTNQAPSKKKWVEPISALIMALATVSTAWCSYESARWTRQASGLLNESNNLERRSGLLSIQGMQAATIHTAMFMEVLAAKHAGNEKLTQFYVDRLPPDARKAYDAWIAQKPFENANADPHPFVPNLYQMRGADEIERANATAAEKVRRSRAAGDVASQYLANTVLFAAVLFFVNAASKFEQRRVRLLGFLFAIAIFSFAVVRTIMLPL